MKRVISLIAAVAILAVMACPVFAAEDDFVPSISYKGAPDIVPVEDENGDEVVGVIIKDDVPIDYLHEECIVVTPVSEAEKSELIPEDAKELLLELYEKLKDGTEKIPYDKHDPNLNENDMVIRDMFDVSLLCEDHPAILGEPGVLLDLVLNLGIGENDKVYVTTYQDGKWEPVVKVTNNGDGTVTIRVEDVGPFAISVEQKSPPAQTGDNMNITLWLVLMVASAAALVVLLMPKSRYAIR